VASVLPRPPPRIRCRPGEILAQPGPQLSPHTGIRCARGLVRPGAQLDRPPPNRHSFQAATGSSRLGIVADVPATPAKKRCSSKAREPYPGDPCRNEDGPCDEQDSDSLRQKTGEKPCANDEPSQGLARQEEQHAVRWLEIFPDLAYRHAAFGAAKPWPGHRVCDVLNLHETPNIGGTVGP
jgi:hypothetical protein